jgi:large subunit ribosomal protein L13
MRARIPGRSGSFVLLVLLVLNDACRSLHPQPTLELSRQDFRGERMGVQAHRATQSTKAVDVERRWFVVDAEDMVLGRLATRVATILRGKHRAIFTPHVDTGEYVIVVNAEKVKLTGRKREQKIYYRHTGYPGGVRSVSAGQLLESEHADRVVTRAVRGMLPRNTLGRQMLSKLKVYAGPNHPHAAQKPEELRIG